MLVAVHDQAVVDLIGENNQLMLSCNLHDLLQNLLGINSSCRVVRVNDNDGFGLVCDLALDIVDVRVPLRLLVTDVVDYIAACQGSCGGPERIVRCRDQDLVAIVQKGLHTEIDQLADTIACVNVAHGYSGNAAKLCVLHDGFSRGKNTLGVGIALRGTDIAEHIQNDLLGCGKAEWIWVADIQLQDLHSVLFHSGRFIHNRASHII